MAVLLETEGEAVILGAVFLQLGVVFWLWCGIGTCWCDIVL